MGKTDSSDKYTLQGRGETEDKLQRLILMSAFVMHFYSQLSVDVSSV